MRLIALAAAALTTFAVQGAEPPPNAALNAFFEREFRWDLAEHPENATQYGIAGFDDRLTDHSAEAVARRRAHARGALAELAHFDPARLSTSDRLSREIGIDRYERSDEFAQLYGELPFEGNVGGWLPVSSMSGPQLEFASLAKSTAFRTRADYENYLKRLAAIPRSLEQSMDQMRAGMRAGWMPPSQAMTQVPGQFAPFADGPIEATPLWTPFEHIASDIPAQERERLAERGKRVLHETVQPAFARMRDFLVRDYLPHARAELAASKLPGGERYYALAVRFNTTTRLSPSEIHEIGLREVKRIRGEMETTIRETKFDGSFEDFLEFLRTDPRFFFKAPEARLAAYRDIAKRADAELPKLFATLPRLPYGVRAMEAYEGDNADHYVPGALDGSRAGFFEANVNNLGKRPSHEMESVLLHEAVPGHHLQIARVQEIEGLPRFRRTLWYTAYGEGWALYAESLGYRMGFYTDPYNHFGALSGEMLRACRLVIDTGIHAFGWTREQSIRYLVENSGAHPDFAAAEVDRYIVWPGQALGYKIGELEIRSLREKARAALGERFDIRRFHNAILDDGPLPLTLLDARIDAWIQREKGTAAR